MAEAKQLQTIDAICAHGAAAAARLTGRSLGLVWMVDRTGAAEEHHSACWGTGLAPMVRTESCSALVDRLVAARGPSHHLDVDRGSLGLSAGPPLGVVSGVSIQLPESGACWFGVADPGAGRPLDPKERLSLEILGQHLAALFQTRCLEAHRRTTEFKYRTLVEQIPAATYYRGLNTPGKATFISPQIEDILGYKPESFLDNAEFFRERLHPEDREWVLADQASYRPGETRTTTTVTYRMMHRDGHAVWLINHALAMRNEDDEPQFVIGVLFDVTEFKQLENQFRHSQKMEAIGRLAGGVAHDFNNLLAVILGYGWLITESMSPDDPNLPDLEEIIAAGERGRILVSQLLATSRRQVSRPRPVRLGEVIDGTRAMFRRIISDDIELSCRIAPDLGITVIDQGQLEQVLMNLLVNASDAMPDGGRLIVDTANVVVDGMLASTHHELKVGEYVSFSVTDTGVGMDSKTLEHIFEPFFTTKPSGKGTGLGLSTVYGIVKQSGGMVWVYSEPGQGTTIRVYLPRHESGDLTTPADPSPIDTPSGSGERILVVEDDDQLRRLLVTALERLDYRVTAAENGRVALTRLAAEKPFDLVLSDVSMPGMSGVALFEHIRENDPDQSFLFMSGYTADALEKLPEGAHRSGLLQKPFNLLELASSVHQALKS